MTIVRRRAGVLGSPIGHSLSPVLHRAAYRSLGLDWGYDAYEVTEQGLPEFLAGCDSQWVGLSLTMPLKRAVLPMLDSASELVGHVGAANTVLFSAGGMRGENTDVAGVVAALRSIDAPAGPAIILGAGGTARAAIAACVDLGVPKVTVLARRIPAGAEVAELAEMLGLRAELAGWPTTVLPDRAAAPIVISTVPAPATSDLLDLVPARPGWLLDVTYHPWPSRLALAWTGAGGRAVGGAEMLLAQAVAQVELMTQRTPDIGAMRSALDAALGERVRATPPAGSGAESSN